VSLEARGRGERAKPAAARQLEGLADRCEKVARQIRQRLADEKITGSSRSPIGAPGQSATARSANPTEFGYVSQLAEVTKHTKQFMPGTWSAACAWQVMKMGALGIDVGDSGV
jgi:hypothetical protein